MEYFFLEILKIEIRFLFASYDGKNWVNVSDKLMNGYELILYNDNVYAVNLMAPGYGKSEILRLIE